MPFGPCSNKKVGEGGFQQLNRFFGIRSTLVECTAKLNNYTHSRCFRGRAGPCNGSRRKDNYDSLLPFCVWLIMPNEALSTSYNHSFFCFWSGAILFFGTADGIEFPNSRFLFRFQQLKDFCFFYLLRSWKGANSQSFLFCEWKGQVLYENQKLIKEKNDWACLLC